MLTATLPADCGSSTAPAMPEPATSVAVSPGASTERPTRLAACNAWLGSSAEENCPKAFCRSWMPVTVLNCAIWPRNSPLSIGLKGS